jgi:hypothetical protein
LEAGKRSNLESFSEGFRDGKDANGFRRGNPSRENTGKRKGGLAAHCDGEFNNLIPDPEGVMTMVLCPCPIMKPNLTSMKSWNKFNNKNIPSYFDAGSS